MFILSSIGVTSTAALAVWVYILWQKNNVLKTQITTGKKDIERTSRLLIEKNVELYDQNVHQEKLLAAKDDFISIVSHQLRTPITEIKWNIASMRDDPKWKATLEQRASVDTLYASAERMVRLIDDIVHLVAAEQGSTRLVVVPYDPNPIVKQTFERIVADFAKKPMHTALDLQFAGTLASIGSDSLSMIISNLVENAFHYTPESGIISVRTKHEEGKFVAVVEDTGIGISEEKRKTMFMKFHRAKEAVEANAGGSGLGLYIVKNIIERSGGSIGFASTEHAGSIFTITLPA